MENEIEHALRETLARAAGGAEAPVALADRIVAASRSASEQEAVRPDIGPVSIQTSRGRRSRRINPTPLLAWLSAAAVTAGVIVGIIVYAPHNDSKSSSSAGGSVKIGAADAPNAASTAGSTTAASSGGSTSAATSSASVEPPAAEAARQGAAAKAAHVAAEAAARQLVAQLLNRVHVPPGSITSSQSPVRSLDRMPIGLGGGTTDVGALAWWTAPGTRQATIDYVKAHPPTGSTFSSTGSAGSGDVVVLGFDTSGDHAVSPRIYVSIATTASGIALRADVLTVVLPARSGAEWVPAATASVDVTVERGTDAATVRRTLAGASVQRLAAVMNALPTAIAEALPCPALAPEHTDRLVFRVPGRSAIVAELSLEGCTWVSISVGGASQPSLWNSQILDRAILTELGLPANYGGR